MNKRTIIDRIINTLERVTLLLELHEERLKRLELKEKRA